MESLGAVLLGHAADLEARPGRGKGNRGKARGGKGKQRHNRSRRQETRRIQAQQEDCWRAGACIPKKGANLSYCDLEDSTAFAGLDCTRCNLSRANLRGVDANGRTSPAPT